MKLGGCLFWLGAVGLGLVLSGNAAELAIKYWQPAGGVLIATTVIWLAIKLRNDKRGAWTNKSPERFSRDYREVRKGRD
jgi:hypothetical protein